MYLDKERLFYLKNQDSSSSIPPASVLPRPCSILQVFIHPFIHPYIRSFILISFHPIGYLFIIQGATQKRNIFQTDPLFMKNRLLQKTWMQNSTIITNIY